MVSSVDALRFHLGHLGGILALVSEPPLLMLRVESAGTEAVDPPNGLAVLGDVTWHVKK